MIDSLDGKVAVVTGGGGGLGRAMGERFAREGMRVVLADVQAPALDRAVEELRGAGLDVTGVVTDVTSFDSVVALRDRTLEAFGRVHVVCNNAGIGAGAEGRLWEHELNDWRWAIAVNVYGVIHGINAFVPPMLEQGEAGHVVNTSSGNGGIAPLRGTLEDGRHHLPGSGPGPELARDLSANRPGRARPAPGRRHLRRTRRQLVTLSAGCDEAGLVGDHDGLGALAQA